MKPTFYFGLWMLIDLMPVPITIELPDKSLISNIGSFLELAVTFGVLWLLYRIMPKTLTYDGRVKDTSILEDVYTGDVKSFRKRLSREIMDKTILAIFFFALTAADLLMDLIDGYNEWIYPIVFGFFTFRLMNRSIKLLKAKSGLDSNPTSEQCREIANGVYGLDYASYHEARGNRSYQDILPKLPAHYELFQVISLTFAIIRRH